MHGAARVVMPLATGVVMPETAAMVLTAEATAVVVVAPAATDVLALTAATNALAMVAPTVRPGPAALAHSAARFGARALFATA